MREFVASCARSRRARVLRVSAAGQFPDRLLSCNYLGGPVLLRRELVSKAGGLRPEFDDGGHHDLYLHVTELAREVGHVDDVLQTRSHQVAPAGSVIESDRSETGRSAI